jgi:hypothetical protein
MHELSACARVLRTAQNECRPFCGLAAELFFVLRSSLRQSRRQNGGQRTGQRFEGRVKKGPSNPRAPTCRKWSVDQTRRS